MSLVTLNCTFLLCTIYKVEREKPTILYESQLNTVNKKTTLNVIALVVHFSFEWHPAQFTCQRTQHCKKAIKLRIKPIFVSWRQHRSSCVREIKPQQEVQLNIMKGMEAVYASIGSIHCTFFPEEEDTPFSKETYPIQFARKATKYNKTRRSHLYVPYW